ncbi:MarR family transcriptional regulator [Brumimicrobium glaciale]|jgi:DNA-binding MarR family transcriptional regulator|uniref:MarR family transcriptional regulator n=1 Tax=Brumimicrobium glaciale TaxID=200475 RepID=A0A4Q4KQH0_9FLAO|nr:MarR family transcriptional regulator [Brumimicrobium glaciale]RYM35780.1 MarR family transcriptional regulator [Brumimicrobium glaciale]
MQNIKSLLENIQALSVNVRHYMHKQIAILDLDITYEMVKVLFLLNDNESMNQQQIADLSLKNKASLTSLIDNMQKRDLVNRTEDSADRRNKIITLTSNGKETLKTVRPVLKKLFEDLYQDISSEEIEIMNKAMLKMSKVIE